MQPIINFTHQNASINTASRASANKDTSYTSLLCEFSVAMGYFTWDPTAHGLAVSEVSSFPDISPQFL
jgi:hypothetical protein